MNRMFVVALPWCLLCLLAVSAPVRADFNDAMEAYQKNDYKVALREFKAEGDKNIKAVYMIGIMFEKGEGMPADPAEAAQWYRKAADKGDAAAQYRLGRLYEKGQGVAESKEEAIKLYRKAARQNYQSAKQAIKRLEAK